MQLQMLKVDQTVVVGVAQPWYEALAQGHESVTG
jgi:hypothetical protein